MKFSYKAIDQRGETVRGSAEASDLDDLEERLRKQRLDLVTGHAERHFYGHGRPRIDRRELIGLCFHLEQMTQAGIPIMDSLSELRDCSESPPLRSIIADLVESITGGRTLSEAMAAHPTVFDNVFVSLILAGETSGRLPEVLHGLVESLQWEDECAAHTRKILIYPACTAIAVLSACIFLMVHLVPQLRQFVIAMGQPLPLSTRTLFFVSEMITAHWQALLTTPILISITVGALIHLYPGSRLQLDAWKLHLPLIGKLMHKLILARFAHTFALLYASGIPILDALRSTRKLAGNLAIENALAQAGRLVAEGHELSRAFSETSLFPPLVIRMLRIGETSGNLDRSLSKVSYFYGRDVRESVARSQAMIEPLLTMLLGCLLGWVMLSVLGPIHDIIGGIRS